MQSNLEIEKWQSVFWQFGELSSVYRRRKGEGGGQLKAASDSLTGWPERIPYLPIGRYNSQQ